MINEPFAAPHRLCAFSRIASNTGARSPGDELMTCNTSAVAVCCSSASRVSVSSRVFSIAMTAWSAKVRTSSICRSVKGSTRCRARLIVPTTTPSRNSGTPSAVRSFPSVTVSGEGVFGVGGDVRDVDDPSLQCSPSGHAATARRQ